MVQKNVAIKVKNLNPDNFWVQKIYVRKNLPLGNLGKKWSKTLLYQPIDTPNFFFRVLKFF